jgi:hypothetical protein
MARDVLIRLRELLAQLAAEDITGVPQRDILVELERARAQLEAETSRRLAELDRQGEYRDLGYRSPIAFLTGRMRCSKFEAKRRVKVARHLDGLPEIRALWARGVITTGHVEAAATIRHSANADEQFGDFEASLARIAAVGQPEDIADSGKAWREALDNDLDRDGADTLVNEEHERQVCTFARTIDDMGVLNAIFDREGAVIAGRALARAYERGHRANDPRTPQRQRGDALVEIFNSYLAGLPRSGNVPHLLLVSEAGTLVGDQIGRAHASDGTRLSAETIRRMACDAFVQHILVDGDMVPLALGRAARLFSGDQRRAMVARDAGCRGPCCDAGPDETESHHLKEWVADQGPTDLENGALFCRGHCHRQLHEGGMTVKGNANGRLDFYDRDGNHLGHSEPRNPPPPIPTKQGKQRAIEDQAIADRIKNLAEEAQRKRDAA